MPAWLDVLAHRGRIIETKGESYRLRDATKRTGARSVTGAVTTAEASQAG